MYAALGQALPDFQWYGLAIFAAETVQNQYAAANQFGKLDTLLNGQGTIATEAATYGLMAERFGYSAVATLESAPLEVRGAFQIQASAERAARMGQADVSAALGLVAAKRFVRYEQASVQGMWDDLGDVGPVGQVMFGLNYLAGGFDTTVYTSLPSVGNITSEQYHSPFNFENRVALADHAFEVMYEKVYASWAPPAGRQELQSHFRTVFNRSGPEHSR